MTTATPTARPLTRAELRIAERTARLELAERQRHLDEQARQRKRAATQRRQRQRAARRAQRRKRRHQTLATTVRFLRRALAHLGENVIAVPIVAATVSAWWFQFDAMRAAGLALLLATTAATSLESLGLAFAGLAHKARALPDSPVLYRAGMWTVVAIAAAVNYRHGSPSWSQPGLTGVVFASLSIGSVAGWELRERQAYRQRNADQLPARRPRFGYAHWLRYPRRTWRALSIAIHDGITNPTTALSTADTRHQHRRLLRNTRRAFNPKALRRIASTEHSPTTRLQPTDTADQPTLPCPHATTRTENRGHKPRFWPRQHRTHRPPHPGPPAQLQNRTHKQPPHPPPPAKPTAPKSPAAARPHRPGHNRPASTGTQPTEPEWTSATYSPSPNRSPQNSAPTSPATASSTASANTATPSADAAATPSTTPSDTPPTTATAKDPTQQQPIPTWNRRQAAVTSTAVLLDLGRSTPKMWQPLLHTKRDSIERYTQSSRGDWHPDRELTTAGTSDLPYDVGASPTDHMR